MLEDESLNCIPLPVFEVSRESGEILKCNVIGERFLRVLDLAEGATLAEVLTPQTVKKIMKEAEAGDVRYHKVNYNLGPEGFAMVQSRGERILVMLFPSLRWDRETEGILKKIWGEGGGDTVIKGWKREGYLHALSKVAESLLSGDDIDEELPRAAELIREITGADRCCIFMNETLPDGMLVTTLRYDAVKEGLQPQIMNPYFKRYPLGEELPRWAKLLSSGEMVTGKAEEFSEEERGFLRELGVESILAVPLVKGDDWMGFMCMASTSSSPGWLSEEVEFLQAAAGIVSSAVRRGRVERELRILTKRLEDEVRARTRELETLYRLESLLAGGGSIEEIFRLALPLLSEVVGYHFCTAIVVGPRERGVYYSGNGGEAEEYARELLKKFLISTADHLKVSEFTFHYLGPLPGDGDGKHLFEFRTAITPGEGNHGVLSFARLGRPFTSREEAFLKTASEDLERAVERMFSLMQERDRVLATLLRNIDAGVVLLDSSGEVIISNPAARNYMPYITVNGEGSRVKGVGPFSLKDLVEHSRKGLVKTLTFTRPRLKHLQVVAKELRLPVLTGNGILLTIQDVTRDVEKRREEEAEKERFAALGQLSIGIAHEFNNYLTSIGGTVELLLRSCHDEELREKLERILRDVRDASSLTKQLTSFARSSEKAGVMDLLPLVKEFAKMIKRTMPDNLEVRMEYSGGAYQITANPLKIRQILLNLTSNARAFMPSGGRLTLKVGRETLNEPHRGFEEIPPGNYILMEVSDTGIGMDAETLKKAFTPFFTTKKEEGANGLGLTVVYSNVKECGGYLDVKSTPGEGTTFRIYFPAHEWEEKAPEGIEVRGDGEKVLIAEDNPSLLHLESDILTSAGFHVLTAKNGEEALEILKRESPRIVVADAVMPRLGGEELYKEAKKFVKDLKMVLVSGYGAEDFLQRASRNVHFLPKPFTADELTEAIWRLKNNSK